MNPHDSPAAGTRWSPLGGSQGAGL